MSYADIIKKKQKEWNCPKLMNSIYEVQGERIPFSSPLFNWATYGGVPRDKIIEFYGDFGSGKSSTALDVSKNASALFRKEFDDKIAELQQKMADGDKYAEDEIEELEAEDDLWYEEDYEEGYEEGHHDGYMRGYQAGYEASENGSGYNDTYPIDWSEDDELYDDE